MTNDEKAEFMREQDRMVYENIARYRRELDGAWDRYLRAQEKLEDARKHLPAPHRRSA